MNHSLNYARNPEDPIVLAVFWIFGPVLHFLVSFSIRSGKFLIFLCDDRKPFLFHLVVSWMECFLIYAIPMNKERVDYCGVCTAMR